jgi:hypothetical protein
MGSQMTISDFISIDLVSLLVALVSLVISLIALNRANALTRQSIVKPILMEELVALVKLSHTIVKGNQAHIKDVHHLLTQYQVSDFALRYFEFGDDLEDLLSAWHRMIASAESQDASSVNPKLVQEVTEK